MNFIKLKNLCTAFPTKKGEIALAVRLKQNIGS